MSKDQDGAEAKTSSSSPAKSDKIALRAAVDAFIVCSRAGLGDKLVDVIDQFDATGRIGFLVREEDRGESVRGQFVDTLETCSRKAGVHVNLMPFPVNGRMLYEVVIRRLVKETEEKQ